MSEATHQTVERDLDDTPERTETMDSVGDALTQSVKTFGRLTKAVVDGLTDVTVTSIDVLTDAASGRTHGSQKDTSDQHRAGRRTSAGRMAQSWADLVTDTVDVITDGMSRSARTVQRAADRFAAESEKKTKPGAVDADKDSSAARNVKKS